MRPPPCVECKAHFLSASGVHMCRGNGWLILQEKPNPNLRPKPPRPAKEARYGKCHGEWFRQKE
jgi:hypothetical protein